MRKLAIVLALSSTVLAAPAFARDDAWYVGIEGGAMIVEDIDLDVGAISDSTTIDHEYGFDVDYVAGYDFGGLRLEAELGYKQADVDEFTQVQSSGLTGGLFQGDGETSVISAMANALLDFGDDDGVNGYVGGGVGVARVELDSITGTGTNGVFFDDKDTVFAYQAIAGIRTAISDNVDLGLKYRFFNTDRFDMVGDTFGPAFNSPVAGRAFPTQGVSGRFRSHSLLASLIFNFGAPEVVVEPVVEAPYVPPPVVETPVVEVAPPAPTPVGPFIVFFDWNRSDITPEAASILDNAAAAYQQSGSANVMLAGNADKSGSNQYNVGLSQRRADAVRAYLVGRGVPDGTISTEAYGEERPLVDTADGVREPQNRNVQINFGPGSGM